MVGLLGLLLLPSLAHAQRAFALGVGQHLSRMDYSQFDEVVEHQGLAVTAGYSLSNYVALRGALFHGTHNEIDDWVAYGGDASLVAGWNLRRSGWRAFVGVGYYVEQWDQDQFDRRFKGIQFVLGGGWAWSRMALELAFATRTGSDYVDMLYEDGYLGGEVTVFAGNATLSYRF